MIRRLQLVEFGDWAQLPRPLRELYMEGLNSLHTVVAPYRHVAAPFAAWAKECGAETVLDIASGGGQHIETLIEEARRCDTVLPKIVLSDLFPQPKQYELIGKRFGSERVGYIPVPVSALDAKSGADVSTGTCKNAPRCIFTAFHHFAPDDAQQLIGVALRESAGVFIAEFNQRKLSMMLGCICTLPIWMCVPVFAKNFFWHLVLFATLLPVIPLMLAFDGLVSCMRAYSPDEIKAMIPPELQQHVTVRVTEFRYCGIFSGYTVALSLRHDQKL